MWFKVKVYDGWVGAYVGEGEYEGGSMEDYEFNTQTCDESQVEGMCSDLYYSLVPHCDVFQYSYVILNKDGKVMGSGKYNNTPYPYSKDTHPKRSVEGRDFIHIQLSRVQPL